MIHLTELGLFGGLGRLVVALGLEASAKMSTLPSLKFRPRRPSRCGVRCFGFSLALRLAQLCALSAALCLGACQAQPQVVASAPAKKAAKKAKKAAEAAKAREHEALLEPETFVVPFVWEAAKDEPLAVTRSFLHDAIIDNEAYMEHGEKFFAAFADKQTPRATVITCADSRVHSQAWDRTPENDDFTIRDIGNQLENVEGSVEYGIDHLNTPLLLIVGHTGCGAVKAAMGDISKLSGPIRKELEHLKVPAAAPGKSEKVAWAEAVVANVNNQVAFALKRYAAEVHDGKVTIVGAVYDFRNDLGQGAGKLVIVNVNGNADPARMNSFIEAVLSAPLEAKASDTDAKDLKENGSKEKDAKAGKDGKEIKLKEENAAAHEPHSTQDVASEMAKIRGLTVEGVDPEMAKAKPSAHDPSREIAHEEHEH